MCLYTCTDPKTLHAGSPMKVFNVYFHAPCSRCCFHSNNTYYAQWLKTSHGKCCCYGNSIDKVYTAKCMGAYVENLPRAEVEDSIEIALL